MYPFKHFKVGSGEFLGRMVTQLEDGSIKVEQTEYAGQLEVLVISKERRRQRESPITEEERSQMRGTLGEMNWLVSSSRPDLAASCSLLQQKISCACVKDLIEVNKVVAAARDYASMSIVLKPIAPGDVEFVVWSDASWANASEKKSQGGYFISATNSAMRRGGWGPVSPLRWKSYKQDRQVATTLGAELLSMSRAMAEAKWLRSMWMEANNRGYSLEENDKWSGRVPITVCLDSKPVFDHVQGQAMTIKDKRLAIEMLLVKKDVNKENVSVRWVPTYQMLADGLTKIGAPMTLFRRTIKEGRAILVEDDEVKKWANKH